eukprot:8287116-Pyramimonas_sp.AAC.2
MAWLWHGQGMAWHGHVNLELDMVPIGAVVGQSWKRHGPSWVPPRVMGMSNSKLDMWGYWSRLGAFLERYWDLLGPSSGLDVGAHIDHIAVD